MIGHKLKELRTEKRFTPTALAKESGISRSTIWKIENDRVTPDLDTLEALAITLGISTTVFFDEKVNCKKQRKAS